MSAPLATGPAGRSQRMAHLLIKVALHRANMLLAQWSSAYTAADSELTGGAGGDDMISRHRAAAHQRMLNIDYQGSLEELAAALTDAWLWRGSSTLAAETLANLIEDFNDEYGLILDPDTATVTVDPAVDLGWAEWSNERVSALNRSISAEKFAKNTLSVAIPSEQRREVDQQLRRWAMPFSRFPDSRERLRLNAIRQDFDAAMQRAAVPAATREAIQFGLIYLSGWLPESFDFRSCPILVDTATSPGGEADRAQIRGMLHEYAAAAAAMAAYADRVADNPALPLGEHITDIEDLLARMDRHRRDLSWFADNSEGLHSLERSMVRCLVHEIGHGDIALPDLLLIDPHSQHLAERQQHDRTGRSTLETAEHRIITALDAAGTGVRDLTDTGAEAIRTTWERTIIHLSALAYRWTPDADVARAECRRLAGELDRQLAHLAVPAEARADIHRTLHDTIDFAEHHAHDGIQRDRQWAARSIGRYSDIQRDIGAHLSPDIPGPSQTTEILDALPAMPHAPWTSLSEAQRTALPPPPERQAGPAL
ncbi:hypothetical protein [Nocardia sp. NPDC047648]|uniref:hypothetical protein n=1 Tax=Nocardia sp. NPDC047648 TaxID=3155625 RepID=UPI0033CE590B